MVDQSGRIIVRKLMLFDETTRMSALFAYFIFHLDYFEYETDLHAS